MASSAAEDALMSRLHSVALELIQMGRAEERGECKAVLDDLRAEMREVAFVHAKECERARQLEAGPPIIISFLLPTGEHLMRYCHARVTQTKKSTERDLARESANQAFDRQRAWMEEIDSLVRVIFGLKLARPDFLASVLDSIAEGDMAGTQLALDAWSETQEAAVKLALDEMLRKAAAHNQLEIGRLLLAWSADPVAVDPGTGRNSLHLVCAAEGTDVGLLEELLCDDSVVAYLDWGDAHAQTPLIVAALHEKELRLKALLMRGADPDVLDDKGKSAADYATGACKEALTKGPELLWAATQRAAKLLEQNEFESALRVCKQALANKAWEPTPNLVSLLCLSGARAAAKLGRYVDTIDFCQTSLNLNSDSPAFLALRADASLRVYDFKQAWQDYQKLSTLDPSLSWEAQIARASHCMHKLNDLYEILEVDPTSNSAEIRRAYLVKCLRWHPDKNQNSREKQAQASVMFKAVSEAHRILSDASRRAEYDSERSPSSFSSTNKRARYNEPPEDSFPPSRSFARESSPTVQSSAAKRQNNMSGTWDVAP